MSRIGRKPIKIEEGVSVDLDGKKVSISGPKGKLEYTLPVTTGVKVEDNTIQVENIADQGDKKCRALYGTARSILQNMVVGVTSGYRKELEIRGVGFRGQCSGKRLVLSLGFSHQVEFQVPEEIDVSMSGNNRIVVEGVDKQMVGETAAKIRSFRPPDPYKGKGIRYLGEEVLSKEGKTVG